MIAIIDLETEGLDATKYVTGGLLLGRTGNCEIYRNKEQLWRRVIDLGIKEARRGKVLSIYSHNAQYDTAGYVDLEDKHLVFFSPSNPLIWSYRLTSKECEEKGVKHTKGKGKDIIKFLDTISIFRMSLKGLGQMIGKEKGETPLELLEKENKTEEDMQEIEKYMKNDCEICLEALRLIKERIGRDGIEIRRLYTINQIAINYMLNKLRKLPEVYTDNLFWDKRTNEIRRTLRKKEIHSAYRGGRVEAFRTGINKNVMYIDCNSLYPYSIMEMRFPDLRSERKIWMPLEKGIKKEDLFKYIGLSRVIVKNKNNDIGVLPVRTPIGNYYFRKGRKAIGTWTHEELEEAEREGYEVIDIEWSVVYKEEKNPFKLIIKELYRLRKNSKTEFDNWFYKQIMNRSIGKMAQNKPLRIIEIDSVEARDEYLKKNYKIIKGIEYNYMYMKELDEYRKPYYCPIIPTLVNAWARVFMYEKMKRFGKGRLLYTDTDSIIFKGRDKGEIKIGKELGQFKIEYEGEDIEIIARKTYKIGKQIKMSGVGKRNLTEENWKAGIIPNQKQITIKSASEIKDVGKFKEEFRSLEEIYNKNKENNIRFGEEDLLIDVEITDINYFLRQGCVK